MVVISDVTHARTIEKTISNYANKEIDYLVIISFYNFTTFLGRTLRMSGQARKVKKTDFF
jgi:hypothetical protein